MHTNNVFGKPMVHVTRKKPKMTLKAVFHVMPDGTRMSGATHSKKSKVIKKGKKPAKKSKY